VCSARRAGRLDYVASVRISGVKTPIRDATVTHR